VPGSPEHPRGWFFEVFPRLLLVENGRRRTVGAVSRELEVGGFDDVATTSLWEVRRRYRTREDYLAEIRVRTGRSILTPSMTTSWNIWSPNFAVDCPRVR
jgi:hypothetical protein